MFRHHCEHGAVREEAQEGIHVLVSQVLHLPTQTQVLENSSWFTRFHQYLLWCSHPLRASDN